MSEPFYVRINYRPEYGTQYDATVLRYVFAVVPRGGEWDSSLLVKGDDGLLTEIPVSWCEPFRESETSICPLCRRRLPDAEVPGACADCQTSCRHNFYDPWDGESNVCQRCFALRAEVAHG